MIEVGNTKVRASSRLDRNIHHGKVSGDPVPQAGSSSVLQVNESRAVPAIRAAETLFVSAAKAHNVASISEEVDGTLKTVSGRTWEDVVDKISLFSTIVEGVAEIYPYAKIATTIVLSITKPILAQSARDEAMSELLEELHYVYTLCTAYEDKRTIATLDVPRKALLQKLAAQTIDCAEFIRDQYGTQRFWARAAKNVVSGSRIDDQVQDYVSAFRQLRERLNGLTVPGIAIDVEEIKLCLFTSVGDISTNIELQSLEISRNTGYNSSYACMHGTRESTLGEIYHWIHDPASSHTLFVIGTAGSGKSAIAHSVGAYASNIGRLAAFFEFRRMDSIHGPEVVLRTLAHDLATRNIDFRRALADILTKNRSVIDSPDLETQWRNLIVRPAHRVHFSGPILVILDGIDYMWKDSRGMQWDRNVWDKDRDVILDFLTKRVSDLPPNFRVLVATRPTPDIVAVLANRPSNGLYDVLDLSCSIQEMKVDIKHYVSRQLQLTSSGLPNDSLEQLSELMGTPGNWFGQISEALRILDPRSGGLSPEEKLDTLLQYLRELDGSVFGYRQILEKLFTLDFSRARFRRVLAHVLSLGPEPFSIYDLRAMYPFSANAPESDVGLILQHMGELLSGVAGGSIPTLKVHPSFRIFLTDSALDERWRVDCEFYTTSIPLGILNVLDTRLRFNICSFPSSHVAHMSPHDPPVLETLRGVVYASRCWSTHLLDAFQKSELKNPDRPKMRDAVHKLLDKKILHLLEVGSACSFVDEIEPKLVEVVKVFEGDHDIQTLSNRAIRLLQAFREAIITSIPHLYLSALTFSSSLSFVPEDLRDGDIPLPKLQHASSLAVSVANPRAIEVKGLKDTSTMFFRLTRKDRTGAETNVSRWQIVMHNPADAEDPQEGYDGWIRVGSDLLFYVPKSSHADILSIDFKGVTIGEGWDIPLQRFFG